MNPNIVNFTSLKKSYKKRKVSAKDRQLQSKIRKVISYSSELKISDTNLTALGGGIPFDISTVGFLQNLQLLQQIVPGTAGHYARIGNNIKLVSLEMRADVYIPAGVGVDTTNNCRCIVLQWVDPPITLTTIPQILFSYSIGGYDQLTSYNDQSVGQFRVLWDRNITLSANGERVIGIREVFRNFKKDITYDNATGLPKVGEFFLLCVSDSGIPVHPQIYANFRLKYTDD